MARARKACKSRGCTRPIHAKGYCQKCYDMMRKKKTTADAGRSRTCKSPGCNLPHHAQGYCQHCYDKVRKTTRDNKRGEPAHASAGFQSCRTPGCGNEHHAKGYCKKCYSRMRRSGSFDGTGGTRRSVASRVDKGRKRGSEPAHAAPEPEQGTPQASPANRLQLLRQRLTVLEREKARITKSFDEEGDE